MWIKSTPGVKKSAEGGKEIFPFPATPKGSFMFLLKNLIFLRSQIASS